MLFPMGFGVKIYKFLSGKMELQFRTSLGAYFTALVLEYRQGVTAVMTGNWDTVKLPISANNYFAIASPATPTTNYWSGSANAPVSVQSVKANSIIIALAGGNRWKANILIIGTV